jgi:hypothetical protein
MESTKLVQVHESTDKTISVSFTDFMDDQNFKDGLRTLASTTVYLSPDEALELLTKLTKQLMTKGVI